MTETKTEKLRCTECRKVFDYGADVFIVEEGVIGGAKGLIRLADILLFCDEKCLASFFSDADVVPKARRVP